MTGLDSGFDCTSTDKMPTIKQLFCLFTSISTISGCSVVLICVLTMDENRVLKLLNEFGVDSVDEDDYKVYEDYFCRRDLPSSSEESSEEDQPSTQVTANASADISLLSNVPVLDEFVGSNC